MSKFKSILNRLIALSAILGLVFVIGCGSSKEKQQMSDFLQQYNKAVDEYSDVVNNADKSKKTKIEETLNSYESRWTNMKIELAEELTPQTLNELDMEYQAISKKYSTLAGKS
jgi:outer membrane murein-binding lipoprotein Lpp